MFRATTSWGRRPPNIDRIACQGLRLSSFYALPSCTAGRAAFITGQLPVAYGLDDVGIGGTRLIPGRPQDRFGVVYFRYSFSHDLTDGLRSIGLDLGDEHGGELFYNVAVTPWLRLTGDLQIIAPGNECRDTAVLAGLHGQIKF
jgi:hypothetical protein